MPFCKGERLSDNTLMQVDCENYYVLLKYFQTNNNKKESRKEERIAQHQGLHGLIKPMPSKNSPHRTKCLYTQEILIQLIQNLSLCGQTSSWEKATKLFAVMSILLYL